MRTWLVESLGNERHDKLKFIGHSESDIRNRTLLHVDHVAGAPYVGRDRARRSSG